MRLRALSRAAQKAIAEAKRKNLKIPIWKDGNYELSKPFLQLMWRLNPDIRHSLPEIAPHKNA